MRFLTVSEDGPAARSPLARSIGGRVVDEADAHRRTTRSVGCADASHLGVLELQAPRSSVAALAERVSVAGVPDADLGQAHRFDGSWWCRLDPGRMIIIGDPDALRPLRVNLDVPPVRATDVSAGHAAIVVAGPLARETIARFCALDLRPSRTPLHACRPGSIARTPGLVIREGDARYLLLFGAAYGAYMWSVVLDAAEHLDGGLVNLSAIGPVAARA